MLNLNGLLVSSRDPKRLVEFYTKIFGEPGWRGDNHFVGWMIGHGTLVIGPHDQVTGPNPSPARIMWNLETDDVEGQFKRIKALGADVIAEPYQPSDVPDMWIATFADPDDNYFQLMSPMPEEAK